MTQPKILRNLAAGRQSLSQYDGVPRPAITSTFLPPTGYTYTDLRSGTSYTVAAGLCNYVRFTPVGAGGGGSGGFGSGGAGGGCCQTAWLPLLGNSLVVAYTIGLGGLGRTGSVVSNAGGDTTLTFTFGGVTYSLVAHGGAGANGSTDALGGTATGGLVNFTGGKGTVGSAGGGGAAGPDGNGGATGNTGTGHGGGGGGVGSGGTSSGGGGVGAPSLNGNIAGTPVPGFQPGIWWWGGPGAYGDILASGGDYGGGAACSASVACTGGKGGIRVEFS